MHEHTNTQTPKHTHTCVHAHAYACYTHTPELQQGSIDQTLTITPEENETCVDLLISNNDIALEDIETTTLTLNNVDDGPVILFTPFSTTNVGILDDDGETSGFMCVNMCAACVSFN